MRMAISTRCVHSRSIVGTITRWQSATGRRPSRLLLYGARRDGIDGRRALQIGLVAVVTLVAFEALAVTTILPEIEADLGGIAWYGWVTSAFFLGTMIGIVFAGDQADRRGAGPPYVIGLRAVRRRPRHRRVHAEHAGARRRPIHPGLRCRRRPGDRLRGDRSGVHGRGASSDVRHPVDRLGRARPRRPGPRRTHRRRCRAGDGCSSG